MNHPAYAVTCDLCRAGVGQPCMDMRMPGRKRLRILRPHHTRVNKYRTQQAARAYLDNPQPEPRYDHFTVDRTDYKGMEKPDGAYVTIRAHSAPEGSRASHATCLTVTLPEYADLFKEMGRMRAK